MIAKVIKTRTGNITLAILMIITGILLDSSGNIISQALHHLAFVLSGVSIGTVIANRR